MAKTQKATKSVVDIINAEIKKAKLLPIPVQTLNEDLEVSRYFGGNLKDFLAAAKTLGAKSIFVETLYLEEEEFYYDSGVDESEMECDYCDCYNKCNCGCDDCKCNCDDCKCKGKKESKKSKKDKDECDAIWLAPEDLDGIDLSLLRPEIANYQDRIGESCGVLLTVPGADHLQVEIFTDWYDQFAEMVDEASDMIEIDPVGALQEMQKQAEKK
ncbi:MAG: hypothetical protein HUK21_07455 [Fibrobacteraceae bacterium]|nr:hypothetical protein [Fibrobacteraceae bacterium]